MIPCAYALLTHKTIATYRCLLGEFKDNARKIKLSLKPRKVMLDFEMACINAYVFHFPEVEIKLCFFFLWAEFISKNCPNRTKASI